MLKKLMRFLSPAMDSGTIPFSPGLAATQRRQESKPGPWLKNAPDNTRGWYPVTKGNLRLFKSGTIMEARSDGWRRRKDLEEQRARMGSVQPA